MLLARRSPRSRRPAGVGDVARCGHDPACLRGLERVRPAAVVGRFWAEDAVNREGPGWPNAGVLRGRAAALGRMQSLLELAGPLQVRLEELIEVDDGRLLACVRLAGPNAASLAPYTDSFAVVHRLREGLVVEADYYLDRAAALKPPG